MGVHPKNKTIKLSDVIGNLEKEFHRNIPPVDFLCLLKIVGDDPQKIEIEHRQFDLIRSLFHNWNGYVRG